MDTKTLVTMLDFAHARMLGSLDAIEQCHERPHEILLWRPAPKRAHIAWQVLHCAATHDRFLNVHVHGGQPADHLLVDNYASGSTPSDDPPPALDLIRNTLERHYSALREFVAAMTPADMQRVVGPPSRQRKLGEAIILLSWHYAHHQGQLHLTWNMYRQATGLV